MKVSRSWIKQLVDLKVSDDELLRLIPLRTIGTKDVTPEFIELDMKGYNRADLLSMRGVAYEVAAITDSKVKFEEPNPSEFVWARKSDSVQPNLGKDPHLKVSIEDEKLAPVYCLAKIEGLKVGPSPVNWVKKLSDSGMRSVNNIADITNLIMLELGQPLHAFDAKAVKDEKIIVRTAKKDEKITTLDGKIRDLETTDLLIADPQNNLGIAGVMGGKDSEITDQTTTILLEAAIFEPANLRKTSTRLGLNSEAGKRFYHGLTKKRLLQALDAAIRMYQELGGKLTALSMAGDMDDQTKKVPLTLKKIHSLIGVEIPEEKVEEYLKKLNFELSRHLEGEAEDQPGGQLPGGPSWVVTPPYYRLDIEIEEDLIEEVARMYGYENIPPHELQGTIPEKLDQSLFDLIYNLKTNLVEQGFTEIQTYSYFSTLVLKNFGWLKTQDNFPLIKIANPISAETEYLRHNLWSNLIEKAGENLKYFDQIAIFEVGKTYEVIEGKIHEEYRLAMLLVDNTDNPLAQLNQTLTSVIPNDSEESQDLKQESRDPSAEFTPDSDPGPQDDKKVIQLELGGKVPNPSEKEVFHPNRSAVLMFEGKPIGGMAEIHPRIANSFGIEKRVAIAEIKIQNLST